MLVKNLEKVALLGSTWVLWLLILLSAVSIGIMLDRWLYFRRFRVNPDALGDALVGHLRRGDKRAAKKLLTDSRSVEAQVLLRAFEWFESGPEACAEAIEAAMSRKRRELERGLVFLGTLGNNAPFIGLLGTVIGVIDAFHMLGNAGSGQNQAGMGNVMVGISEALIATGVGLLVALPAVVGYNIAQKRVGQIADNVHTIGKQVLTVLRAEDRLQEQFNAFGESAPEANAYAEEDESPEPTAVARAMSAQPEPS